MPASDGSIFDAPPPIDPHAMARRDVQKSRPKRFWKEVSIVESEGGYGILIDGRPTRTPNKHPHRLPSLALAEALAAEWRGVGDYLDPNDMPLTRILNTALEGVAPRLNETADDIAQYAGSDLLCYRAISPVRLVEKQNALWDPVLDWALEKHRWRFNLAAGVMHVPQPQETLVDIQDHIRKIADPLRLAALHVATTLTGSAVLALALAEKAFRAEAIWTAAHVDEDVQMAIWGQDEEALARRARRLTEFNAAALFLNGKS
jgi:chaperone required for assembly of F1-ATPase